MRQQLRFVSDKIDKKSKGITNSLSSYEGIIPDAPNNSFKQKKGTVCKLIVTITITLALRCDDE